MLDPCGSYVNASGILKSPGFPFKYQNEIECIYTVSVPENNIIKILFSEFDLEFDPDLDCRNDFLEMNDGDSEYSPILGRFCGNESDVRESPYSKQTKLGNVNDIPSIFFSTQNKMWIRYIVHKVKK